ncbi:MAG: nodulation efficiency protein D [Aliarcobacter sp.]|nr:nodulation efficiency protein D [Aliarcobacter sp.]MDD2887707.1 nodulation efficiency protein D [Aliarcobacter sp.]
MPTQIILSVIDPYILLAIGVALIAFEAVIASFVLIWFGFGFILTALISYIYIFSDGLWQIAIASIFSLILLLLFRKKALESFLKSKKDISDNFFDEKGMGEIKNSKVLYKATYWDIDSIIDEKEFVEGEKVVVLKTFKNKATIEKR